ncbi:hypothetical protein HanPI659440_Chr09g0346001 [Helianthus annuus]|nr:hypothetical protein HanPI659440_Chr09g0346001 [Helianthus annuus]
MVNFFSKKNVILKSYGRFKLMEGIGVYLECGERKLINVGFFHYFIFFKTNLNPWNLRSMN